MKKRDALLTVDEVADKLGLSEYTVEHHISEGKIPIAYWLGEDRRRLIRNSEVLKYRKYWMNEKDYTLKQIAVMVGKSRSVVHWHFCRKRNVRPSGRRRQEYTYDMPAIRMVARAQGWTISPPEIASPLQLQIPRVPEES